MESDNTNDLYKECLRNHAASLGSYATDGCGEFTLDDTLPSTLQCVACGCHRNFHRKVSYSNSSNRRDHIMHPPSSETVVMEMIDHEEGNNERNFRSPVMVESGERSEKKRFRTKFTAEQKEKMLEFAEKLGWKLQRKDEEDEVGRFCKGVGISRQVFKVWMHNHKNSSTSASAGNASSPTTQ